MRQSPQRGQARGRSSAPALRLGRIIDRSERSPGLLGDGSWVAIDFETANENHASVCSVGLVAVERGAVVGSLQMKVRPPFGLDDFSPHATAKHGMTLADVLKAPSLQTAIPQVLEFVAGRPLVAHNASFERAVLDKACSFIGIPAPDLMLCCTLRLAKQTWKLPSYKLPEVAAAAGYHLRSHHHALKDAEAAAHITLAALAAHDHQNLGTMVAELGIGWDRTGCSGSPSSRPVLRTRQQAVRPTARFYRKAALPLLEPSPTADASHPLYGKTVCFTGELTSFSREAAWRAVAARGAQPKSSLVKSTDFLVVGKQDPHVLRPGAAKSSTHLKAERYGTPILDEAAFLALLKSTAQ